jgi:hypothetical protein
LLRYNDLPGFVRASWGAEPDEWQDEVGYWYSRDNERYINLPAGHGVGKSAFLAWQAIHFLLTRFPCKVIQTAPSQATLQDGLFAETKMWVEKLPPLLKNLLAVTGERIVLKSNPASAFLSVRTARAEAPDALHGIHQDFVLLQIDEGSGVHDAVFEASRGSMSGPCRYMIAAGNPVHASGWFYDSITTGVGAPWRMRRISCIGSKLAPPEFVADIAQTYGEHSNVYRVRVLGEPPEGDDDTIIPLDLVTDCYDRDVAPTTRAPLIWGLDVARLGANESALAKRRGNTMPEKPTRYNGIDTMTLCGRISAEYFGLPDKARPVVICVDGIGMGAPVVDRLKELGLPAVSIVVSEHRSHDAAYFNLKAHLWWMARAWFAGRDVKIPKGDEEFVRALTLLQIDHHSTGKLMVESKDKFKRRLKSKAPRLDAADAFVLTFADQAVKAMHGKRAVARRGALKRRLKGVV